MKKLFIIIAAVMATLIFLEENNIMPEGMFFFFSTICFGVSLLFLTYIKSEAEKAKKSEVITLIGETVASKNAENNREEKHRPVVREIMETNMPVI